MMGRVVAGGVGAGVEQHRPDLRVLDQRTDDRHLPASGIRVRIGPCADGAGDERKALVVLEPAEIQQMKLHGLSVLRVWAGILTFA